MSALRELGHKIPGVDAWMNTKESGGPVWNRAASAVYQLVLPTSYGVDKILVEDLADGMSDLKQLQRNRAVGSLLTIIKGFSAIGGPLAFAATYLLLTAAEKSYATHSYNEHRRAARVR